MGNSRTETGQVHARGKSRSSFSPEACSIPKFSRTRSQTQDEEKYSSWQDASSNNKSEPSEDNELDRTVETIGELADGIRRHAAATLGLAGEGALQEHCNKS